jgi:hypothetical protein
MYDDDDPPIRRSDLRCYLRRYLVIYLLVGSVVSCGAITWLQFSINHDSHELDASWATSTAVSQQVATQEVNQTNQSDAGVLAVAQNYYSAISSQDYVSAYGDLSSATYNGKQISQAAFIQRARAIDTKDGRVTNFQVSGSAYNPVATVQVTRKDGRTYSVTLDCTPISSEMNGPWAIVSFSDI